MSNNTVDIIGRHELPVIDRWDLERRTRALTSPVYMGNSTALCRVLGRYKLFLDTRDVGFSANVIMDGFWEPWITIFIARTVQENWSVVDVGANHGYYTLLLADLVGQNGCVAAFEPNPNMFTLLRRSVAINGFSNRTTILQKAASAKEGDVTTLFMPPNEPKNSRLVTEEEAQTHAPTDIVRVATTTLASALAEWPRVDFAKIDVEGAEESVMQGFWPIIVRDQPDIILEFNSGRCQNPEALLDQILSVYPTLRTVEFSCSTVDRSKGELLTSKNTEDHILYLSNRSSGINTQPE